MFEPRTTIAVVRNIIGLTYKEMAALIGYSMPTIQSLDCGRLKPSFKVAERISLETGVSLKWLLDGQVSKEPTAENFKGTFSRRTFEETQAAKSQLPDFSISHPWLAVALPLTFRIQRLCAILGKANEQNQIQLCSYKIDSFLDGLEKEFGADKTIDDLPYYLAPTGQLEGIAQIIDVMPIIEAFHDRLRMQTAKRAKRKAPTSQGMPEKPTSDEVRVTLAPIKSDFPMLLNHSVFRRRDITDNRNGLLGLLSAYVDHPHVEPPPPRDPKNRVADKVASLPARSKHRVKKRARRV